MLQLQPTVIYRIMNLIDQESGADQSHMKSYYQQSTLFTAKVLLKNTMIWFDKSAEPKRQVLVFFGYLS